jgi:hypothetical protein
MALLIEPIYTGEFLLSEGPRSRSRDTIVIEASETLVPGTVLGFATVGALAAAYAALGTNTGTFTCGAVTVAAGTEVGEFDVVFEDATHFVVLQPPSGPLDTPGDEVGHGVLGTAFSAGGLTFTLTAGGTAAVPGDSAKIAVSQSGALNQYAPVNATATDGTQNAAAILFNPVTTGAGVTAKAVAITRSAEVKSGMLTWPVGATAPQLAAWTAQLAALGIIAR